MKRKSKLIPYISLIPFTDIIHMLRDWLLIGTSVIILTGVGLSYYESRKGRMESRRSEARSEARWEEFRVELLCRVPEPPPPPQRHHLCSTSTSTHPSTKPSPATTPATTPPHHPGNHPPPPQPLNTVKNFDGMLLHQYSTLCYITRVWDWCLWQLHAYVLFLMN